MDDDIIIKDTDEPWQNYQKLLEITRRIKSGVSLKTSNETKQTKYSKVLFFINKLLKQKNKEINGLLEFKFIREDFFSDKEELLRIIKKYGIPLLDEFKIEYKLEKKNPNVFKLLRKLLKPISYTLTCKKYKEIKYYNIVDKNIKFTTNELINIDSRLTDDDYEL